MGILGGGCYLIGQLVLGIATFFAFLNQHHLYYQTYQTHLSISKQQNSLYFAIFNIDCYLQNYVRIKWANGHCVILTAMGSSFYGWCDCLDILYFICEIQYYKATSQSCQYLRIINIPHYQYSSMPSKRSVPNFEKRLIDFDIIKTTTVEPTSAIKLLINI